MSGYNKTSHTVFYHRYHIVWITKYRYKVLTRQLKLRIREIIAQVSEEMNVRVVNGALSADHIHLMLEIPPHISVSNFVKIVKGRSSRKIQQEFPEIRQRYWGKRFWGRGFFSSTSGNVTDDVINNYIDNHSDAHHVDNSVNISLE